MEGAARSCTVFHLVVYGYVGEKNNTNRLLLLAASRYFGIIMTDGTNSFPHNKHGKKNIAPNRNCI